MNILRVIASMDPIHGGPTQGIRNSVPALEHVNVSNEVLCFDAPDAPFLKDDAFPIHAIGPAKGPYAYCPRLRNWLLDNFHRFDAVVIHGLWLYNNYGTYRAWKTYKKQNGTAPKIFIMPHGMLDPFFQKAANRRLKAVRNWLFWHLIERHAVNNIDGLLFTCEQEMLLARTTFSAYQPKTELNVGYGIGAPPSCAPSMRDIFLTHCPMLKNKPYWLFMSRIHQKKGVDMLLRAYLKLKAKHPELPALVVAGPGLETPYGNKLSTMASNDPSICFPGMLTGDAKWGALYGCEAFLLPSHQENFGIAVVEALACGKPVLISNQVNIYPEIQEAGAGIIGHDTEEGIYNIMKSWYYSSPEEKAKIAVATYQAYQKYFTVTEAARNLKNILVG